MKVGKRIMNNMSWNDIIKVGMTRKDYINAIYLASEFITDEMTSELEEFRERYPNITSNDLNDVVDKLEMLGDWLRKNTEW
jgi:hypothetical protein